MQISLFLLPIGFELLKNIPLSDLRKSIYFIVPYPVGNAPSQRFRFEQYFKTLSQAGYSYYVSSFLTPNHWQVIFIKGRITEKLFILLSGFTRRWVDLFRIWKYDYVFIHRESTPIGPPVFEWIIAKILKKKIIYDFDDAIWLTDNSSENKLEKIIRWRKKVQSICTWSHCVSCGNEYLSAYAGQFNNNVIINPSTIDTIGLHNPIHYKKKENSKITIGWTGSHSTLKYLEILWPVLQTLEQKYPQLEFLVISNKKPERSSKSLQFITWSMASEIEDLAKMDIGVMPLPNDEWSKGKCGFKLLQYMSLNIPALASPVGANRVIIKDELNGLHCNSEQDWIKNLERLINSPELRRKLGVAGRNTVENHYSVSANSANFISLFE